MFISENLKDMDIDREQLIAKVYPRKEIWDKKCSGHANRMLVDKAWNEISEQMGIVDFALRKKWKYMRDQFCIEAGKVPRHIPIEEYDSNWPFFKSLLFLKDVAKPRRYHMKRKLRVDDEDDPLSLSTEDGIEEDEEAENDEGASSGSQSATRVASPLSTSDKKWASNNQRIIISQPKSENVTKDESCENELLYEHRPTLIQKSIPREELCEDELFFKSILPHVRKIPQEKKLRFRNRMLEIVEQFAYSTATSNEEESNNSCRKRMYNK